MSSEAQGVVLRKDKPGDTKATVVLIEGQSLNWVEETLKRISWVAYQGGCGATVFARAGERNI